MLSYLADPTHELAVALPKPNLRTTGAREYGSITVAMTLALLLEVHAGCSDHGASVCLEHTMGRLGPCTCLKGLPPGITNPEYGTWLAQATST